MAAAAEGGATAAAGGGEVRRDREQQRARKKAQQELRKLLEKAGPAGTPEGLATRLEAAKARALELAGEAFEQGRRTAAGQRALAKAKGEGEKAVRDLNKQLQLTDQLKRLCQELQVREREARAENGRIVEREKEKRDVLLADFKGSIEGIQKSIEGHGAREKLLLDENEALREKLQNFGEQVKLREDHLAKFEEAKRLEVELLEVKLKQQEGLVEASKAHLEAYEAKLQEKHEREQELVGQIAVYSEKFAEFNSTITKSNDLAQSFKTDSNKMLKQMKALQKARTSAEKECGELKLKTRKSDLAMIEMLEEQRKLKAQNESLQGLCRALQARAKGEEGVTGGEATAVAAE